MPRHLDVTGGGLLLKVNKMWTCPKCKQMSTAKVTHCRKCGTAQPNYGFVDEKKSNKPKKKKVTKSRDPLISNNEDRLFVSTLKFKDEK